jgi:hypothetical protein
MAEQIFSATISVQNVSAARREEEAEDLIEARGPGGLLVSAPGMRR